MSDSKKVQHEDTDIPIATGIELTPVDDATGRVLLTIHVGQDSQSFPLSPDDREHLLSLLEGMQ